MKKGYKGKITQSRYPDSNSSSPVREEGEFSRRSLDVQGGTRLATAWEGKGEEQTRVERP